MSTAAAPTRRSAGRRALSALWTTIKVLLTAVLVLVMVGLMFAVNTVLVENERMVNQLTGYNQSVDNSEVDTTGLDLDYYTGDYSADEIAAAESDLYDRMIAEGTVLLENDGLLPLSTETELSFFSANAGGTSGEGLVGLIGTVLGSGGAGIVDGFEAEGFSVNHTLADAYAAGACAGYGLGPGSISFGDAEDFSINECPLDTLLDAEGVEDSLDDTVPVFVLSRVAGEGRDMPRSMYQHTDIAEDQVKSYLEPDSVELEILSYLNDNFDDVILLVNSNAAVDLHWVADFPSIGAVVYAPSQTGSVAPIVSGSVNPSGRTVDTFAADALASPAAQNFGSFQYYTAEGEPTQYNYVTYAEGIYVGYRYYETRYEDAVLGQGNAGDFDYASEVVYPFGHGLSYTTFEWDDYSVAWNGAEATATVTVTNTGDVAGKDVVQLYVQKPYTDYDVANGIEKAAAELIGYAKTPELAPGESAIVTVEFTEEQLKSYDANGEGTYILEPGDYLVTAATDSHAAVDNVLAAKGAETAGDAALVATYAPEISEVDAATYSVDSVTGTPVVNLFDEADADVVYLTRSDWTGTFPAPDGEASDELSTWGNPINGTDAEGNPASYTWMKVAEADLIAALDSTDSGSPVDPASLTDEPVYGAENGLTLIDMRGLAHDDPAWDDLLDQLTPEDYQMLVARSGYGTEVIESVDKPFGIDADTASGLFYGGTGMTFPNSMMLAQSWNQELAHEYGRMIGNEALIGGANGWYAPSMNIHRTPFSGRNGEYYSEDPFLSGAVGANATLGASEMGMYTFIKHFALNDQENHRGDRDGQFGHATWANEQSIREIYLVPFEMSIKAGEVDVNYVADAGDGEYENATTTMRASTGVMSAFNRIGSTWTGGSYALNTELLREEWGFQGFIITDNANTGVFMDAFQMIESGADGKLTALESGMRWEFDEADSAEYHYAREAAHNILWTMANSNAMQGAMPGSDFVQGAQTVTIVQWSVNILGVLVIAGLGFGWYRGTRKRRRAKVSLA